MRKEFLLFGLLSIIIVISGCIQQGDTFIPSGTQELVLNEQDLHQLGMTSDGTGCQTDEYQANEYAPITQYTFCNYIINSLNDTEVVLELKNFANLEDLNNAYQYDSMHLYSIEGLISENNYGDLSRFRVNNENDYGGQYNEPGIYFYHLWIVKNEYLIHITSKGRSNEAEDYIAQIAQQILLKFG